MACTDGLTRTLARTGNTDHGVHCVASVLQIASRIRDIALELKKWDPTEIINRAMVGEKPGYEKTIETVIPFVLKFMGGEKATMLSDLIAYEQCLPSARSRADAPQ